MARRTTKKKSTRKKSTSKRPTKPSSTDGAFSMGATTKADTIKFKSPTRGTQYQPILDRMVNLKCGQGFTVSVPKGTAPRNFHNRLNAVLRRYEIEAPKGCKFEKRTTEDGKVGIKCVKA